MAGYLPKRNVPLFSRQSKRPWAEGYNIRVGSRWFRTVANHETQIQLGTKDSLAQRVDQKGSIYENVLDLGYAWARSDLSGGEGLDWDPRKLALDQDQAALDQIRFWESAGIETRRPATAGYPYALRLARGQQLWDGSLTNPKDITTSEKYIFIADGDTVSWYDSWDVTSLVGSATPKAGKDIRALAAAPNDTVVAVCENGDAYAMRNYPYETDFTHIYGDGGVAKLAAQGIWYVNGRFLMSAYDHIDNAQLNTVEYYAGAWHTDVKVDTASSPFWSVVESGPAIVAACGDGTIRSYAPTEKDGDMSLVPYARTTMPEGEAPFLLGSNANVLLILTSMDRPENDRQELRVYQAEVLNSGFNFSVGQLRLRREWLAVEHEPLVTRNMVNTRDEIFWFVKERIVDSVAGTELYLESLWRFDIVTNGLSRSFVIRVVPNQTNPDDPPVQGEQIDLNGLVMFDDVAGGIDFNNGRIFLANPNGFQEFGYMIFPNVTFGLNTDITWLATVVETQNLVEQGALVELWRSSDPAAILDWQHPTWVLAQRLASDGSSGLEVPMVGLKSRTLALQLRIYAAKHATQSPFVTRVALRGIPAHRDFIMLVPFNVSDYISTPNRAPVRYPGLGQALQDEVMSMVGESVEVLMLKPEVTFRGIINNVSEPVDYVSDRGSVSKYVMVEFRGQRLTMAPYPIGDTGTGLGLLGVATVGTGQYEAV